VSSKALARDDSLLGVDFLDREGCIGARGERIRQARLRFTQAQVVTLTRDEFFREMMDVKFYAGTQRDDPGCGVHRVLPARGRRRSLREFDPLVLLTTPAARAEAVREYCAWLHGTPAGRAVKRAARRELRGRNLACWCPTGHPCHAHELLKVANA